MKVRALILSALLAASIAAPDGWAQDSTVSAPSNNRPQPPNNARFGIPTGVARVYQDYLYGVITKLNRNELVLNKTKFGVPQTIKLNPKTKFTRNGKRSAFNRLKIGDPVYVDVKTDKKTGAMSAKKVVSGINVTG